MKPLDHPFNVMRHARWEAAPRMPQVFAAAFTAAGVSGGIAILGTTVSYASILGYVAYTALSSVALRALAPKVPSSQTNKGTIINAREASAPQSS